VDRKVGDSMRCAALYRVSTSRQAAHRDQGEESLPVQRQAIRRYVEAREGWTLVAEFAEEGVSAYRNSSEDRDVLQDVLRQAKERRFETLLLFKADRLSRQSFEYPFILTSLKRAGVRVIAVADEAGGRELRLEGQSDKLIRFIEGWQAETESLNTSIRVSEAMRQMAEKGRWTGGRPPYGYRYDKSASPVPLVIDPEEARWIKLAFDRYLNENVGTTTITFDMNTRGARQRNGSPWSDARLRSVMQNPIVAGRLAYGRTKRNGANKHRSSVGAHSLEGVILSNPYPELAIVDESRWQAAMQKMASYNNVALSTSTSWSRADSGALLFTGMARCAHCGGPLVHATVRGYKVRKDGTRLRDHHAAYLCHTRSARGAQFCDGQRTYAAKKVESALLAAMHGTLSAIPTEEIVKEARRQAEQSVWAASTRVSMLERKLAEVLKVKERWLERLNLFMAHPERSLYSEEVLASQVRESERTAASIKEELERLTAELEWNDAQRQRLEEFLASAHEWWHRFLNAPRMQQKALLKQIVSRVVVGKGGYEIHWRISPESLAGAAAVRWTQSEPWPSAARA